MAGLFTCGITAFIGAILGHVAKRQIRERNDGGAGLATAGVIAGWIIFGLYFALGLLYFVLIGVGIYNGVNTPDPYSS
jgi:hypothetical protein